MWVLPRSAPVRAAGTSLTGLLGVGAVIAVAVIGDVRHVSRFPNRDHFAACNGTAPIEVSSGGRKIYRLSRRGIRRLNHASGRPGQGPGEARPRSGARSASSTRPPATR
jgi:transposase